MINNDMLRYLREVYGYSVRDMSARMGICPNYLYAVETGKKKIGPKLLQKFCRAFEIHPRSLELLSRAYDNDPGFLRKRFAASLLETISELHDAEKTKTH